MKSKIFLFFKTINSRGLLCTIKAVFYHFLVKILLLLGNKFYIKRIYNYKLKLDLKDPGISRTLLLYGERELDHKFILEKLVKSNMTILDIGSNIGYYAIMQLKLLKNTGKLIAVEPSKSNVNLLHENLKLNGYLNEIEIHNKAVSNKNGKKLFFISKHSNLNTFHNTGSGKKFLQGKKIIVNTITIKKLLNGRKVDLIRMDVEGHEVSILDSLISLIKIKKFYPDIIFETHISRYNYSNNMLSTLKKIFNLGYKITIAGTSSERGTVLLKKLGYDTSFKLRSDDEVRSIIKNIKNEDAINLICKTGGLRTVTLSKTEI